MREMATMSQIHRQHRITRRDECGIRRDVGLGSRVRLHIGMIGTEQFAGTRAGMFFRFVDHFAAAVVASTGIALCVLVGEYRSLSGQHRIADDVLACDEIDLTLLTGFFSDDDCGDFGVSLLNGSHLGSSYRAD